MISRTCLRCNASMRKQYISKSKFDGKTKQKNFAHIIPHVFRLQIKWLLNLIYLTVFSGIQRYSFAQKR